jgi:hypothetical protein
MGTRRAGRDRLWGGDSDRLGDYARDYVLEAHCQGPHCQHSRAIHIPLLIRIFGSEATLGRVRAKFRCHKCGLQGARLEVRYVSNWHDERR